VALFALAPAPVMQAMGLTPTGIALVIAFLVISLGIHEAAHAWVALKCGDPTGRDLGRITLNPIPHIDPFMTIVLPVILAMTTPYIFGGAKPVPVSYHRLRHPLRDMALVAFAGPLTNFLLAIVFLFFAKVAVSAGYAPDMLMPQVLVMSATFNVLLAVFNLMPVPPLDGSRVMAWLLPSSIRGTYMGLERFGMILVIVLVFMVPNFQGVLRSGISSLMGVVDVLTGGTWQ
jgi:Zn-dependent protease